MRFGSFAGLETPKIDPYNSFLLNNEAPTDAGSDLQHGFANECSFKGAKLGDLQAFDHYFAAHNSVLNLEERTMENDSLRKAKFNCPQMKMTSERYVERIDVDSLLLSGEATNTPQLQQSPRQMKESQMLESDAGHFDIDVDDIFASRNKLQNSQEKKWESDVSYESKFETQMRQSEHDIADLTPYRSSNSFLELFGSIADTNNAEEASLNHSLLLSIEDIDNSHTSN